jgi:hypothetical protein
MVNLMNPLQVAKMVRKGFLLPSVALLWLSLPQDYGSLRASETNATATVSVSMNSITPVGEVSILVTPGMEFQVVAMQGDRLIVSKGTFTGSVPLHFSSLWKPAPSSTSTPPIQKAVTPLPKSSPSGDVASLLFDQAKKNSILIFKSFAEEPIVAVSFLLLGVLLSIILQLLRPKRSGLYGEASGIVKKLQREMEELRTLCSTHDSEMGNIKKTLLETSVREQETGKKLKAALEQETLKINSLGQELDDSRNLAEAHKIEIIDLEKRLSENFIKHSESLKQMSDLLERERNLSQEAISEGNDKMASLQRKFKLIDDEKQDRERDRKALLDKIAACQGKCVVLEERCRSHEEQLAKSASAPCPHCDQPVKLILLERGSNKCPKCGGNIFCE